MSQSKIIKSSLLRNQVGLKMIKCMFMAACSALALMVGSALLQKRAQYKPITKQIFSNNEESNTDGKYLYVVSLLSPSVIGLIRSCSGSLLSPTWVLTAAHCDRNVFSVQYGDMSAMPLDINQSRVRKFIPHQGFRPHRDPEDSTVNDIAMLLVEDVPVGVFGRLSAVDSFIMMGYQVQYTALDIISEKQENYEILIYRPLQLGVGSLVPCPAHGKVIPCICVAPQYSSYELKGDSGGPLLFDGKIAGIAYAYHPPLNLIMYIPISPYLSWISTIMFHEELT